MKKWMLFALALLAAGMVSAAALQQEQRELSEKLIRLHVVANSDSQEDQAIKLQVRDAVLAAADGLEEGQLEPALPEIQQAAEVCLRQLGREETVTVSLGMERFPTRMYDSFSLPAGTYRALRVTIGEGAGKNWWCVVFPSLCFRATAAELEEAAVSAGFTTDAVRLITGDGEGYILKFKVLEWLAQVKERLF